MQTIQNQFKTPTQQNVSEQTTNLPKLKEIYAGLSDKPRTELVRRIVEEIFKQKPELKKNLDSHQENSMIKTNYDAGKWFPLN